MNIFIMRDTNELLRMTNLPGKAKETQTKLTSKVTSSKVLVIHSCTAQALFLKPNLRFQAGLGLVGQLRVDEWAYILMKEANTQVCFLTLYFFEIAT